MAWVKIPPEHHALFRAALPRDPRIEAIAMFGSVAAKANGHMFAALFGRSAFVSLPEPQRTEALGLEGAVPFDPMGWRKTPGAQVMVPERCLAAPAELRRWLSRAFEAALYRPPKAPRARSTRRPTQAAAPGGNAIDHYLVQLSPEGRAPLDALRQMLRDLVPEAEECLSDGRPAFRWQGQVIAGFAATARGGSYSPFSGKTLTTLAAELAGRETTKSALHFGRDRPLPKSSVRKLVRARLAELPGATSGTVARATRRRRPAPRQSQR